ncbi:MAG: N-acetyl sugar amidotransferase [Acetobacterales bacterium]
MRYCVRCLYPESHPLGLVIDDAGVCSGCRVHEEKDSLDWDERFDALKKLAERFRAGSRDTHDCIVPVTGARDSWFTVHVVKNLLGLNPQLVSYNRQFNTPVGIRNLANLRTIFNCDLLARTAAPEATKAVTRAALAERGSVYWHVLAGQSAFAAQCAVRHKIPLVIWGAHQGLDQVGMFSHLDEVEMTRRYRHEHDLMGLEIEDLAKAHPELEHYNLDPWDYPFDEEIEAIGVRGIHLGNYIRWDSKAQHEAMIDRFGYETAPQQRTFDTYNDVDCFHYAGLHDAIKFRKHGYGKATDHATREIRLRRMTREQGMALASRYRDVEPADTSLMTEWLGIDEAELWSQVDRHRNQDIWKRAETGWELRDPVENHADDPGVEDARLDPSGDDCEFRLTPPAADDSGSGYVLIGRGYVEPA